MKHSLSLSVVVLFALITGCKTTFEETKKPNILFCIADDWGWPHAGVYGDEVVQTPSFDKLAAEGVLFDHAYISSPSCTPSRGAILTGQQFFRLGEGANLWSTLNKDIPVYPLLLEEAGYFVGSWRKTWGPGDLKAGGYVDKLPAGKKYPKGFESFLNEKPVDRPFCFWLGASDPHRAYEKGSGAASGIDISKIDLPDFYPESDEIRNDIADYYFEVQRFDSDVQKAIDLLRERGELDNTIIVVTGDHGMPFPRCKGNLYDWGSRVPLVFWWGDKLKSNSVDADFVSLTDLAPTFLDFAGVEIPEEMTGRSLKKNLLVKSKKSNDDRSFVVYGRERHVPAQLAPSIEGYPSRAIRTKEYLYIRNYEPDRWPAGVPEGSSHPIGVFADCDNGPTKSFLIDNQEAYKAYFNLSFAKRPAEELYAIKNDPDQIKNLAQHPELEQLKNELAEKLHKELTEMNDPRVVPQGFDFDKYPYRSKYKLRTADK